MMDVAIRNRAIKKLMEMKYGRGNVRVRGSRGTAYGSVHINIEAPSPDESYCEYKQIEQMIAEAGLELHTYYGDQGNEKHTCLIINFERNAISTVSQTVCFIEAIDRERTKAHIQVVGQTV